MTANARPIHRISVAARHMLHRNMIGQMGLIVLFWLAGQAIATLSGLPIPGGVIGLFLVLALFASGRLQLGSMRRGAKWFIGELLLFFIPAVIAVIDHGEFIGLTGLKIIAVIVGGTVIVMVATAFAVEAGYRLMLRLEGERLHAAE